MTEFDNIYYENALLPESVTGHCANTSVIEWDMFKLTRDMEAMHVHQANNVINMNKLTSVTNELIDKIADKYGDDNIPQHVK